MADSCNTEILSLVFQFSHHLAASLLLSYEFCLASDWMLCYYFTALLLHQPMAFWLLLFWGFFHICMCLLEGERNVTVLWSCLQKQSSQGHWYRILCSPDYSVKIWTLLGGKTTWWGDCRCRAEYIKYLRGKNIKVFLETSAEIQRDWNYHNGSAWPDSQQFQ